MPWRSPNDPPPWTGESAKPFVKQAVQRKAEAQQQQLGIQASTAFGLDEDPTVQPGEVFSVTIQGGPPGAVGEVGVRIVDFAGATVTARNTGNIVEAVANSGIYVASLIAPANAGQYIIVWDDGASTPIYGSQDLVVTTQPSPPPTPVFDDRSLPCQLWITGTDILAFCPAASEAQILASQLDDFAAVASELLFELSGRRYSGICNRTVRPCRNGCACDWRILSWYNNTGYGGTMGWGNGWWWGNTGNRCGCGSESQVRLPGYPVRSITQVTVDGVVVNPNSYRLDNKRYLTAVRYNDTFKAWPTCQDMSLPDSPALGVFTVSYQWGSAPPTLGIQAALELGCQLSMALLDQGACTLPPNTVQVQRQGLTIDRSLMSAYIAGQSTGLPNVDAFLATYNPNRLRRRPALWSPDVQHYGRKTS